MKLEKEEKEMLKALKAHPGYNVLMKIEHEAEHKLGMLFASSDLSNQEHIKVLEKNQIYLKARKDLLANIDSHTREIYSPDTK